MNPLSYMGVNPSSPSQLVIRDYAPTQNDSNILVGTIWLHFGQPNPNASDIYMLVAKSGGSATWLPFGSIDTINGLLPSNNNINIEGGPGIQITNQDDTITIAADSAWIKVPEDIPSLLMVTNKNYILQNIAGAVEMGLPLVSSVGDTISIVQSAGGTFFILQDDDQQVIYGSLETTVGDAGLVYCSGTRVIIKIVCTTANLVWQVVETLGTTTYT